MGLFEVPEIELRRRADAADVVDDRRVRRAIASGTWIKIAPGVLTRAREWKELKPIKRHCVRVLEGLRRARGPLVLSHFAAAAGWDIDILGDWPGFVDVTRHVAAGGRSTGLVRRHLADLDALDLVPFGRHFVTSPAQTAHDLARVLPFAHGVAAVDQAAWSRRAGGALTTIDDILLRYETARSPRGAARALRAISFASPLAANVRESESRVLIARLGFPVPRLQERRVLRTGRLVHGDFYFPDHDHWAELDGRGKYRSPEYGTDRDAAQIAVDEKNRENEIRREVRGFSRWEPADLDDPRRLYDILTGDGLPSVLPRP